MSGTRQATGGATVASLDAVHLYPTTMNTYGDRGNVAALTRRAALRGLTVRWHALELGDEPPARCDLVFMGGGQDRVQHAAAADLARLRPWLSGVIDDGGVVFAVCAGLQLLGRRYVAADGSELAGLGLLDLETLAARPGEWRLIGNVVAEVPGGSRRRTARASWSASKTTAAAPSWAAARPLGRVRLRLWQQRPRRRRRGQRRPRHRHLPARSGAAQERLADRPPAGARAGPRRRRRAGAARPPARGRRPARGGAGSRARRGATRPRPRPSRAVRATAERP